MKEADTDWLIYHLIPKDSSASVEYLVEQSGLEPSAVKDSLCRLEKNLLISRKDGDNSVLPINESLIRCQIKYDNSLPYTIENGVITEKKRRDP